ncbi:DUF4197 domain-containing protein [Hymenobacter sp. PAMC 26628]|uniref:DUF4197 domain-containing protein n=1 Tax=Hymenobacter sp. PAMC 26628 TaxID=1484118 RepID=UPI00076FFB8C|nr:DUF4197 domain-containing protein [Hymenobacter sp. PAMC 26628]AMJ65505.1 hypothetical protein AXW84_08730 [Hymenobacter sp. PAMC 26628]
MSTRLATLLLTAGLLTAAPAVRAQTTKKTTTTTKTMAAKTAAAKAAATKAAAAKTAAAKAAAAKVAAAKAVATPAPAPVAPLTEAEASAGIKDALNKGVTKAVEFASEKDGFNLNDDIHIPFPEDMVLMKSTLGRLPGMSTVVSTFETQLNRAAEAAAPKAKDIFLSALTNISLTDALSLVTSSSTDAATQFLRKSTEAQLVAAFKPDITAAISQVGAEAAYTKMTTQYNRIPLMTPVQTDLSAYTTQKAVDGIFILMAQEEAKIRRNPAARTTDLLKRVFATK